LLLGAGEEPDGVRPVVLDGPIEGAPTPGELVRSQDAFDEHGTVFPEALPQRLVHA
jgi:hypothetical protein